MGSVGSCVPWGEPRTRLPRGKFTLLTERGRLCAPQALDGTTGRLAPAWRDGDRYPLGGPAGVQHQPWHFHGVARTQAGQARTGEARVRGQGLPPGSQLLWV